MAKIQIDEGWLLEAFQGGDGSTSWYLDRATGDVIMLMDDLEEEEEEIRAAIEEDDEEEGGRFLCIPGRDSHDGFRLMERFVATVEDPRIRGALYDALERRRPFRSFKDALMAYPEVRERWFAYEEADAREEAVAWLENLEIEYELVPHMSKEPRKPG
jgi:hypothetical protein